MNSRESILENVISVKIFSRFVINFVDAKENSFTPAVLAIVNYLTLQCTTELMLLSISGVS